MLLRVKYVRSNKILMGKKLSSKAKRNISRIIPFGLIWLISGLVFLIVDKSVQEYLTINTSRIGKRAFLNNLSFCGISFTM